MRIFGKLRDYRDSREDIRLIEDSEYFDKEYYLKHNNDINKSGSYAAWHYLRHGAWEGRNPSGKFDTSYYLRTNPDVRQTGINPLLHYIKFGKSEGRRVRAVNPFHGYGEFKRMDVIATKHTMFVALLCKKYLNALSIESEVHEGEPENYLDVPYIIICPQFVKKFPDVYFAFQMEQTVSSRWLTEDYFKVLGNACAVMDYSLENVRYFKENKVDFSKRIYYCPIDYYDNFQHDAECAKEYDVVFYGDKNSCDRRREILDKLSEKFKVKICSEVFGNELYKEICKAKVLVNIHYYDNALLETTRLYETLSLNTCVIVSESSSDKREDERLNEFVDFVPAEDYKALEKRIEYWVNNDKAREEKITNNKRGLSTRANSFKYFFYRLLLAYEGIAFDEFYSSCEGYLDLANGKLCLSLPEDYDRREEFDKDNKCGFKYVDALRHQEGWKGCALSYKFIFRKALNSKMENITICEDDVIFKRDFTCKIKEVTNFLNTKKDEWDIFSGFIADYDDRQILWSVETLGGIDYVRIGHTVSMVFNIYNRSVFGFLSAWEDDDDMYNNTIDRYMEREALNVYAVVPFLVGHKAELNSSIWDFSNTMYIDFIIKSKFKLEKAVAEKKMQMKKERFLDEAILYFRSMRTSDLEKSTKEAWTNNAS